MKKKITLLFLLLLSNTNYSQNENDKIIYFDSIWKKSTKENYSYYRIVKELIANELYDVKDYYKSGVLQMEGSSLSKENLIKKGDFIYYYENGNVKIKAHYDKLKIGLYQEWYENGTKKIVGEYFKDKESNSSQYKLYQYWNSDGKQTVIDGNGFYEFNNKTASESGNYKDGLQDGKWRGKYLKGKILKYEETYKKGVLVSGISTDDENIEHKYDILESRPVPEKGMKDFYEYIARKYIKPSEYYNVSGKIYVQFFIDKEGKITEPKIVKGLDPVLDQEAIRVITSYPKWIPGKQRGLNVRVLYGIPVSL